ncbi:MAG: 2-hydroxy-3-oxopropionate reductase [Fusobacterium gastrosuis]|uniref:2-hydroxy-3-oxopropionate reductase n=1 Tax=Fusobacterium gastrosuis TaxID=1755100 RepID=UPI0025CFDE3D|nr:2-hydroxy-3-oxopropionate reductase [uncultured Fusobacterium sp.]MDD7391246.1 2-hydroxy-3-oxopropionate reductase [Fusobacteriaceae bacterium]MDY5795840.1 2-hydroxy-3-oxopropionate reductase [Fusobacterium gastrosuis]
MKVGFIGLGIMGRPMSKNLLKAGYDLTVFDFNKNAVEDVVAAGAKAASSGKEVGENVDVLITMLPNSPHVKSALFDKNGAAEGLKRGTVVIDMSSINPVESQNIAKKLAEIGIEFLDAPVSGGEPKAIDGTISVMVGGKQEIFDKYYDLMKSMAGSVVRVGDVGAGNTTKLANQMIVALNIAALSEAFVLCEKANVDPQLVFEAIKGGLAGSTVMNAKAPMMINRNFEPGFRIELHIKDLQNALDTSHAINVSLPLTSQVMEMMQALKIDGRETKDHSAILNYYEKINNVVVGKK